MKEILRIPETHPLTWWLNDFKESVFISEYSQKNGYSALKKVIKQMTPKEIITVVKSSELRGRGGCWIFYWY